MGGKYELRFYSNSELAKLNGGYETVYTNSFIEFLKLRFTKKLIYFKRYF
jgi:hypothetical protein